MTPPRGNKPPERPQDIQLGHELFGDGSSQDIGRQTDNDQPTSLGVDIVVRPDGKLIFSNGNKLSDVEAEAYRTLQRYNAQHLGAGSSGSYGSSGLPRHTELEYPDEVRVTVGRHVNYTAKVGDPRYLGVASQAVADMIARDACQPSEGPYTAAHLPHYSVVESNREPADWQRGGDASVNGRPTHVLGSSGDEIYAQNNHDPSNRRSNKKTTIAVRAVALFSVAALALGIGVGLDKSTTFVYEKIAGDGNTTGPYWSGQGKHDTESAFLIGPMLNMVVPNVHGDNAEGGNGK